MVVKVEETEELLLLNVGYSDFEGLEVVSRSTELVVEAGDEKEPAWFSGSEPEFEGMNRDVWDDWIGKTRKNSGLEYEEEDVASVVWGLRACNWA